MAYIDKKYYDDDYKGERVEDVDEFERLAQRASDQIDIMTNHVLSGREIERTAQFIQDQVKKATASIVEQYALNGGYESVKGSNMSSVTIGAFSYNEGSDGSANAILEDAYKHLAPTGLLYRGLMTHG